VSCASGLVCIGGACVESCIGAADCPADGECRVAPGAPIGFCFAPPRDSIGNAIDAAIDAAFALDAPALDAGIDAAAPDAALPGCAAATCGTVSSVCMSEYAGCAVRQADGHVVCWGSNGSGVLGDGVNAVTPAMHTTSLTTGLDWSPRAEVLDANGMPLVVASGSTALACHSESFCAVLRDGTVACWGGGLNGEIGQPPMGTAPFARATTVPSLPAGITAVVSDGNFGALVCALAPSGVACWGSSLWLGGGTAPRGASALGAPTELYLEPRIACTLGADVECLGIDTEGELGPSIPLGSQASSFVSIPLGSVPSALGVGAGFACAIAGGAASCWGEDVYGSLGRVGPTNACACDSTPAIIASLPSLDALFTNGGTRLVCARAIGGDVYCWGELNGQCWPPRDHCEVPALVPELHGMRAMTSSLLTACAILADGTVACFGSNLNDQLGRQGSGAITPERICVAASGCP
jgi:hypothetical protein